MRLRDLRDEQRARREHKVRAEDGGDGGGEAEGPVGRVRVDETEEEGGDGGDEGAGYCGGV